VRVRGITVSLTLLALALPAAAGAQDVPSGNSGIDQYRESIPGVGGNKPTGPGASGTGKSGTGAATGQSGTGAVTGGSGNSPSTAQSLEKLGPDGKGAAEAAAATNPGGSQDQGSGFASPSPTSGDSGDSGPGMGVALPIILALVLAGAVTLAVLRRRRGTPPGAA
jgi:hypothetical protein